MTSDSVNSSQSSNDPKGLRIALERIEREAREKTGILNLGGLGLVEPPPELFQLQHLRCLSLGSYDFDENEELNFRLENDVEANQILPSWDSLASLSKLLQLSLSGLMCDDLVPLSGLTSLRSLDCWATHVRDLTPLSGLSKLESLVCSQTKIRDLAPLSQLTNLQSLDFSFSGVSDLLPLSGLTNLQFLNCQHTQVSDLKPISGLKDLEALHFGYTQIWDLSSLSSLIYLKHLDCSTKQVSDLTVVVELKNLQSLQCSWSQVRDLSPLSSLTSLQSLDCRYSKVRDLSPIASLTGLKSLDCHGTKVDSLSPLVGLTELQVLTCSSTKISELSPLSSLTGLHSLHCGNTEVNNLTPLIGLINLQSLNCSRTLVSNLSPLSELYRLRELDCSKTHVNDLSPLNSLTELEWLNCSDTWVCNLKSVTTENVREIDVSNLELDEICLDTLLCPSLAKFFACKTKIPGIPQEVLSKDDSDNCLPRVRAHLADLKQGTARTHDVKLIVIGNGRVGKTQIARRLRGLELEAEPNSTHGIEICSFDLQSEEASEANSESIARVHLWDFGGQDIYHGTHALFMRTNAVFLLVWSSESEASPEHEYRGLTFKNHRVPYWLKHIGHLAGFEQPVLIVQNQCDSPRDEQTLSLPDGTLPPFRFVQQRHYSAINNRGRAGLDEVIREAIAETIKRRGKILIGRGRAAVIAELDAMRRQDEDLPASQRRFRTLGMDAFRALCEKTGGISSVKYFLEYLHDCGLVFYRPGMFNDQIILDQAWALQAIYTVLDRSGPYTALRQLSGRFTRSLLALSAWKDYSAQEQQVFLSMMESCGICFKHRAEAPELGIEAEYIAPELLPSRTAVAGLIASQWEHPGETVRLTCDYAYDDPSLIRSIIAEIGKRAKESAIYWRFGACGYDLQSSSHFLLDYQVDGTNSSRITLECKGSRSQLLANELRKLLESIHSRHGAREAKWLGDTLERDPHITSKRLESRDSTELELEREHADPTDSKVQLKLGTSPSSKAKEHFVSYAWGDDTPEGIERIRAINELCDKAKQSGIEIIRDSTHIEIGDRISKFMDRIGESQRVFVILSEKYLKSEFCMYELWSIWKNCKQNPDQFLSRIRAYKLPCAQISTTSDQIECAGYWIEQKSRIDAQVQKYGLSIIGETALKKYTCITDFAAQTSEILSHIADVLKPKSFDDLLKHGFVD